MHDALFNSNSPGFQRMRQFHSLCNEGANQNPIELPHVPRWRYYSRHVCQHVHMRTSEHRSNTNDSKRPLRIDAQ